MGEFKLQMKHFIALALDLSQNRVGHAHSAHPLIPALKMNGKVPGHLIFSILLEKRASMVNVRFLGGWRIYG